MSGQRRRLIGKVVSNKMDKTVVVVVERTERHRLYGKVVYHKRRFKAHDEGNACNIGDTVQIVEAKPYSREKRWAVESVLIANPRHTAEVAA
jgi:small subunit ribosomal protein S17